MSRLDARLTELDRLSRCRTSAELEQSLRGTLGLFGITAFVLGQFTGSDPDFMPQVTVDAWPPGLAERYMEAEHFRYDPVAEFSLISPAPFRWAEIPTTYLDHPNTKIIRSDSADFDLRDGFCVPLHTSHGSAGFELAGPSIEFVPGLKMMLRLIAYQLSDLNRIAVRGLGHRRLTPRERDVLTWVADGKTIDDIANILVISPHTVGEHLKNIRRKLHTTNNTHSVVRAFQSGQLQL